MLVYPRNSNIQICYPIYPYFYSASIDTPLCIMCLCIYIYIYMHTHMYVYIVSSTDSVHVNTVYVICIYTVYHCKYTIYIVYHCIYIYIAYHSSLNDFKCISSYNKS